MATPLAAALVGFVSDTPPLVKLAVTVDESVVTTLPPESSTLTTGWVARAAPLASVVLGWVVMTSWVAAPVDMVMVVEAARGEAVTGEGQGVGVPFSAVEGQAREGGHAAGERCPGAVAAMEPPPLAIDALAVPELTEVTTLPPESSTLTTGWVARAAPLASVLEGWVVMTSLVAAPVDIVMLVEAAEVKPSPVKVRV